MTGHSLYIKEFPDDKDLFIPVLRKTKSRPRFLKNILYTKAFALHNGVVYASSVWPERDEVILLDHFDPYEYLIWSGRSGGEYIPTIRGQGIIVDADDIPIVRQPIFEHPLKFKEQNRILLSGDLTLLPITTFASYVKWIPQSWIEAFR